MGEKFGTDFDPEYREVPDQVSDEDAAWLAASPRTFEEQEFDLRVRMFALDMAVQAAPTLVNATDNDESKRNKISRAAREFETYLRGEVSA